MRFGREEAATGEGADTELAEQLSRRADEAAVRAEELQSQAREAATALAEAQGRASRNDPVFLERLVAHTERLDGALASATAAADRFEAPLRARVDAGCSASRSSAPSSSASAPPRSRCARRSEAGERAAGIDVELAKLQAEQAEAQRRLEASGAEPAEGDDRDELAASGAPRAPPRAARPGESARQGGVREREGAPRRAVDAARRPGAEPAELEQLAKERPRRSSAASPRHSTRSQENFAEVAARSSPAARAVSP